MPPAIGHEAVPKERGGRLLPAAAAHPPQWRRGGHEWPPAPRVPPSARGAAVRPAGASGRSVRARRRCPRNGETQKHTHAVKGCVGEHRLLRSAPVSGARSSVSPPPAGTGPASPARIEHPAPGRRVRLEGCRGLARRRRIGSGKNHRQRVGVIGSQVVVAIIRAYGHGHGAARGQS